MNDLPPWYSIAAVGLATALGAAFAALWHGLWPAGAPNLYGFTVLCLLIAFFAVNDTFRALTRSPMDPGLALVEVLVGGGALFAMTQRPLPFFVGLAFCVFLRVEMGGMTTLIINLYDRGARADAERLRRRFSGMALGSGMAMVLCGLGSRLETSPSLLHWGFGPIAVVGGVCALLLVAGAQYEVVRARFRSEEVAVDPGFGAGWWGPVVGLIAAVVVVAALVPPLPSAITLQQVGAAALRVAEHTSHNTGPQNLPTQAATTAHKKGPAKIGPIPRGELGLYMFLTLVAIFLVVEVVRSLLVMRRLGVGAAGLAAEYARRLRLLAAQAGSFFTGLYALVREGLRSGDWRGLQRLLRRWWRWVVDLFATLRRGNVWRVLVPRSAAHRAGAEFAIAAGPRTAAGAAWRLPPGDPRRRIREMYRDFMARAAAVGLGRRPHQTPQAFSRMVSAVEPEAAGVLGTLTASYEVARFSERPLTEEHVGVAERAWNTVTGFLRRRRPGDAAPPAGSAGSQVDPGAAGRRPAGRPRPGAAEPGRERTLTERPPGRRRGG
jgi:uncharacterized membrane protein (Fun14 family)